jgi:hypothetical protein
MLFSEVLVKRITSQFAPLSYLEHACLRSPLQNNLRHQTEIFRVVVDTNRQICGD